MTETYYGFDYYYAKYPRYNENSIFHYGFWDAWNKEIFAHSMRVPKVIPAIYKIGWDAGMKSRKEQRMIYLLRKQR